MCLTTKNQAHAPYKYNRSRAEIAPRAQAERSKLGVVSRYPSRALKAVQRSILRRLPPRSAKEKTTTFKILVIETKPLDLPVQELHPVPVPTPGRQKQLRPWALGAIHLEPWRKRLRSLCAYRSASHKEHDVLLALLSMWCLKMRQHNCELSATAGCRPTVRPRPSARPRASGRWSSIYIPRTRSQSCAGAAVWQRGCNHSIRRHCQAESMPRRRPPKVQ